ncbi:hypothetical protein C2845_PM18G03210 [Panicum miliaceum]|uniref:AP2/ERF domain-containing protein n=1 Tax=Panicum miliaceum TaxID=4540 RepID=A0A3L6PKW3_PANMI|nr:hypothetical protein C2845_PM18G03210 [Panicum miliaceum]
MGSRSTRGRNGGVPPGKWYGALRQQVPHGTWIAYVYDLNGKVAIWHSFFNTAEEAKHALDLTALDLHGNPTNVKFSGLAGAPPTMSGAALESWQREGGAGYSHSGYMPWQSGGKRETQGPEYIFWQGGEEGPQFPDFHYWEHGNGHSC